MVAGFYGVWGLWCAFSISGEDVPYLFEESLMLEYEMIHTIIDELPAIAREMVREGWEVHSFSSSPEFMDLHVLFVRDVPGPQNMI